VVVLRTPAAGDPSFGAAFDSAGMVTPMVGLGHLRSIHMSVPVWVHADCPTCLYLRLGNPSLRPFVQRSRKTL
jgi:hypothetical protein